MKSQTQPPVHPLTYSELLARCMGEADFAEKIIDDFLTSFQVLFADVETSIRENTLEELPAQIHRLKGTAATVAAKPLFQSLVEFESLLADTDNLVDRDLHASLAASRQCFEEVRQYAEVELLTPRQTS